MQITPPVTRLYFLNPKNNKRSLPWSQVLAVDLKARRIRVRDLERAQSESTDSMAKEVLLGDDILDALVLDLQNRRATRANDLWLEQEKDRILRLRIVGVALRGRPSAVPTRLSHMTQT